MTTTALESIAGFRDKWPFARVNGWRMHVDHKIVYENEPARGQGADGGRLRLQCG